MSVKSLSTLICLLLGLALGAGHAINRHVLVFSSPTVGGDFGAPADCATQAEALLIALGGAPHIHATHNFVLATAVRTLSPDDCAVWTGAEIPAEVFDRFQQAYQTAEAHYKQDPALGFPFMEDSVSRNAARFPAGYLGNLYLLIANYDALSSGKGIIHYLRCDYSLNLEPYKSFWASDLHAQTAHQSLLDRVKECRARDAFDTLIAARLASLES